MFNIMKSQNWNLQFVCLCFSANKLLFPSWDFLYIFSNKWCRLTGMMIPLCTVLIWSLCLDFSLRYRIYLLLYHSSRSYFWNESTKISPYTLPEPCAYETGIREIWRHSGNQGDDVLHSLASVGHPNDDTGTSQTCTAGCLQPKSCP